MASKLLLVAVLVAVTLTFASAATTYKCYVCDSALASKCGDVLDSSGAIDLTTIVMDNSTDTDYSSDVVIRDECLACKTTATTADGKTIYRRECVTDAADADEEDTCDQSDDAASSEDKTCMDYCKSDLCDTDYTEPADDGALGLAATPVVVALSLLALLKNYQ